MRKRVAFAAAVIHSPEVLFLDEPFEGIDPAGVALIKQWLRRFTEQKRTVFITSHVLETVERLCDTVAIITRPGKLMWHGDITMLARDGAIRFGDREFSALEPLFLHLTGERYADLDWL
jgi:ABC-2 type transport system ATP-binding protein